MLNCITCRSLTLNLTQVGQKMWKIQVSFDLHAHEGMDFTVLIFTKLKLKQTFYRSPVLILAKCKLKYETERYFIYTLK